MANINTGNLEEIITCLDLIKHDIGEIKIFKIKASETIEVMTDIMDQTERINDLCRNTIDCANALHDAGLIR